MENAEGGGSNQTLSQTAEVLLNLEAVPDYDVNIRENRSRVGIFFFFFFFGGGGGGEKE